MDQAVSVLRMVFSYCKNFITSIPLPLLFTKAYRPVLLLSLAVVVEFFLIVLLHVMLHRSRERNREAERDLIDPLTGLDSFSGMSLKYTATISDQKRKDYCAACVFFDARRIERHFGALKSNALQRYTAKRILEFLGKDDLCCRVENGMFLLIFPAASDEEACARMKELLASLDDYEATLFKEHRAHFFSGIYRLGKKQEPLADIYDNCRLGCIRAMDRKVPCAVCTEALLREEALRTGLDKELERALANDEFELYFQCVYSLRAQQFVGVEVLSRWNHPEKGILSPAYYIDAMRTAGLIDQLDLCMLDKACALLERWSNTDLSDLRLSCNFTRLTISRPEFRERFRSIVEKHSFDHSRLLLEITEDALDGNQATSYENILACKADGFIIALDDFGSGHTAFVDLCNYPIDLIKIDRTVAARCLTERGIAMLNGLVEFAQRSGMEVLCEGVENEQQNDIIRKSGCDYIQGFYYSDVFPAEEGIRFLEAHEKPAL